MQQFIAMLAQLQERFNFHAGALKTAVQRMETGLSAAAAGLAEVRQDLRLVNQDLRSVNQDLGFVKQDVVEIARLVASTNQRLDSTNQRLDSTNQRLDGTDQRLDVVVQSLLQTSDALKEVGKGLDAQSDLAAQLFKLQLLSAQQIAGLEQQHGELQKQIEAVTQRLVQVESRLPKDAA